MKDFRTCIAGSIAATAFSAFAIVAPEARAQPAPPAESATVAGNPPAVSQPAVSTQPAALAEQVSVPVAADSAPAGPTLATPTGEVKVHAPQFGMNLESVERDGYLYTRRQWKDMVRNDPELYRLHRRGRLVVPGAILTGIGAAWLVVSTAQRIDRANDNDDYYVYDDYSYSQAVRDFVLPVAMLGAGVPMLVIGAKSRAELHRRHMELMAAPVGFRGGGGVSLIGRF